MQITMPDQNFDYTDILSSKQDSTSSEQFNNPSVKTDTIS